MKFLSFIFLLRPNIYFILGSDRRVFHTHTSTREPCESGALYNTCNTLILYGEYLLDPAKSTSCGSTSCWLSRLLLQYTRCYPPHMEAVSCIRNVRTHHAIVRRRNTTLIVVLNTWRYTLFKSGSRICSYTSPQASISKSPERFRLN